MAIVVRKARLLHLAIDRNIDTTARAIADAAGVSERTMRRALKGHPISDHTFEALRSLFETDDLFEMRGASRC